MSRRLVCALFTLLPDYLYRRYGQGKRFGTLVANVVNRHPALLANAAASVDLISGGRFVLGVGAGASPASPFAVYTGSTRIPSDRAIRRAASAEAGVGRP